MMSGRGGVGARAGELSGGNQQKLVVGTRDRYGAPLALVKNRRIRREDWTCMRRRRYISGLRGKRGIEERRWWCIPAIWMRC